MLTDVKAEQTEEEADSQRHALDTYFQRRQKRLQEAQERAELLNRAICISTYLFNEGSSHVMKIFDEEAQAMQSARNSSRMLEEATTTGTTILANHQCKAVLVVVNASFLSEKMVVNNLLFTARTSSIST
ncbi:hypothetical protein Tco_0266810 [Tanacetum coccineum]